MNIDIMSNTEKYLLDNLNKIVPWEITTLHTRGSTMLIILPSIIIRIVPGFISSDYILCIDSEKYEVIYRKDRIDTLLEKIESIVKGELDRKNIHLHKLKKLEKSVNELKTDVSELRKENLSLKKMLREGIDEIIQTFFHPDGVQANLLKEDFEKLKLNK
jgi:septal ring factor EnvC (AmiA/AmiB activator)